MDNYGSDREYRIYQEHASKLRQMEDALRSEMAKVEALRTK